MQYKTIVLNMLEDRPKLMSELQQQRQMLATMHRLAGELQTSHEAWQERLVQARPGSDPAQIASEALELALADLESRLPNESAVGDPADNDETFSLDGALRFLAANRLSDA